MLRPKTTSSESGHECVPKGTVRAPRKERNRRGVSVPSGCVLSPCGNCRMFEAGLLYTLFSARSGSFDAMRWPMARTARSICSGVTSWGRNAGKGFSLGHSFRQSRCLGGSAMWQRFSSYIPDNQSRAHVTRNLPFYKDLLSVSSFLELISLRIPWVLALQEHDHNRDIGQEGESNKLYRRLKCWRTGNSPGTQPESTSIFLRDQYVPPL